MPFRLVKPQMAVDDDGTVVASFDRFTIRCTYQGTDYFVEVDRGLSDTAVYTSSITPKDENAQVLVSKFVDGLKVMGVKVVIE